MPKRKRSEASLDEKIAQWEKELYRGLKTAKGFERQRYAKRIRDSPPEKVARLEKEVLVLKVRCRVCRTPRLVCLPYFGAPILTGLDPVSEP